MLAVEVGGGDRGDEELGTVAVWGISEGVVRREEGNTNVLGPAFAMLDRVV